MSARRLALPAFAAALAVSVPAHAAEPTSSCAPKDLAALAGWGGVWASEGTDAARAGISGAESGADFKLNGRDAPWNADGWARVRGLAKFAANPDRPPKALGYNFPMMMDSWSELKFVIAPAETMIVDSYRDIRTVYTDGRGHVPEEERWATNWGDSVGCWDGDTLTIDTVGVRFDPGYSLSPPLSEQARFVERIRLVAPGRLENEMTVVDPEYLTEPWTVRIAYVPAGIDRLVHDVSQDRVSADSRTIEPPAEDAFVPLPLPPEARLSAAELDRVVGRYTAADGAAEVIVERRGERLFFQVPPFLTEFLPLLAIGPLSFEPFDGGSTFRFVTDATGDVTGYEGTNPEGAPTSGKRIAS